MIRFVRALLRNSFFFAKAGNKEDEGYAKATFAGGCFWCLQPSFNKTDGVIRTVVGYTGGKKPNPSYEQVGSGSTGHVEAIEVTYDSKKVSYKELLKVFWRNIDPTQTDGQFCDIGSQYHTVIFYHDETQKQQAETSKEELVASHRVDAVATEIRPATMFYPAEDDHQDYYKKSPFKYQSYKIGSGRDKRLKELWGKP